MKKKLLINGQEIEVEITSKSSSSISFSFNGKSYDYSVFKSEPGKVILSDATGKVSTVYSSKGNLYDSASGQFKVENLKSGSVEDSKVKSNQLISPLPGKVIKVCLNNGSQVKEGDEILRIEAMKMEHRICAQIDGKIKAIYVKEGDTVQDGQLLGEIEP
ncbi:MAG: biotin/lipoyl-binding protein [Lentisphaeraceae bacterium]|nr:biotin/lipoyl-binding protein [Lentisphaeraceae bacterium]